MEWDDPSFDEVNVFPYTCIWGEALLIKVALSQT
jgi:hypothetical protein